MATNYPFGKTLTIENYQALRSLALKLTYKEFHKTTGLGHGIHNQLRRFSELEQYKNYTKENQKKYYQREEKRTITLKDIYEKLLEIETKLDNQSYIKI